jgi:acetyl esterase/lipase
MSFKNLFTNRFTFLLHVLCVNFILAQEESSLKIHVDTSFTIQGTKAKVLAEYPFTKLAESELSSKVIEYKNIVYTSYGNRELHIDLFIPAERVGNSPFVLIIHGGGWRSGNKSMEWPTAQKLAEHGYAAATVEYRLSPEAKYPAAIYDLKTAIKWIKSNSAKYDIDSNRIAVSGCSSGGELAAFLGFTGNLKKFENEKDVLNNSSVVQAVIDIDGILDFTDPAESGKDTSPLKPSAGKAWLGSSFKENPELWREASPINYVNKNCPPILFINSSHPRFHAGRDSVISIFNSYQIYSEVRTIDETPHPFWLFHPWFDKVIEYMVSFLDRTLCR